MPLPQPKTALNNVCSVVFNNTLYTYSADAFQSLRLEPGAEWEELPQGEKVTGAVCVGSTTGTPETSALFIVGGTGGPAGYQGLQKYTYATGQWETIPLSQPVTQQRLGHSAVYLNSTNSILIYAGNQDGSNSPSSQTFTIGASAPYEIRSWDTSPLPLTKPLLLPWSTSEAVLIGGSAENKQVFLFSVEKKWVDSGTSLVAPLPKDASAIQGVLMTGDDGSKTLFTFDPTESPNKVQRTVLYSGPGVPVPNAAPVRRRMVRRREVGSGAMEKRQSEPLTLNNWPAYNSTLAPTTARSNYALAQAPDGTVVIAGGNDEDVLCMFNPKQNSWEDAESMLGQARILSVDTSSTSSAVSTTTTASSTSSSISSATFTSASVSASNAVAVTETPSPTAAPAISGNSGPDVNTILGAVLGGFFGLAILLAIVYLCIQRRRKRQAHMEAGHIRRASGVSSSEKDGIGFAKDSLTLPQGPPGVFRGHQPQGSQSSFSSMAILMGRAGREKSVPPALSRKGSNESRRDSSDSILKAFKSSISKPIPQVSQPPTQDEKAVAFGRTTAEPRPRNVTAGDNVPDSTRRSSGWNRYWSGGSALNLLGFGSGNRNSNGNGNGTNSVTNNSRPTTLLGSDASSHYSNPHRITQDSATVPPLQSFEPRLSLSRVTSYSPTIAVYNEKLKEGMRGQIETQRPISAVSEGSASAYSSGIPESVHDAWDPTAANQPWGADRALNGYTSIYSTHLTPASQNPSRSLNPPPRPPGEPQPPVRDDMSWLNLGGGS